MGMFQTKEKMKKQMIVLLASFAAAHSVDSTQGEINKILKGLESSQDQFEKESLAKKGLEILKNRSTFDKDRKFERIFIAHLMPQDDGNESINFNQLYNNQLMTQDQ